MTTHGRGAIYLDPAARAALDVGALHGRAIRLDARGKVLAYKMTSQCASGSGQFLENIARSLGIALDKESIFCEPFIERFIASPASGRPVTRRTLRTSLRFIARALHPTPGPRALSRESAKAPYSATELASYLALAAAQPTPLRRARSDALICLGAGAGLIGAELRRVRGTDVLARSGGVLVCVGGRRPRAVPVLAPFQGRLLGAATFFADHYLVSGTNPDSHNVTNPVLRSLSGGVGMARLEPSRLRSSYLVAMAEAIGLKAFMDAAGISCSQRLGDLVRYLAPLDESATVALLGACC